MANDFLAELQAFRAGLKKSEEPLAKAVDPNDYHGIVSALDHAGASVVDHTAQLNAHPREHNGLAHRYKALVTDLPMIRKRTPAKLGGVSKKVVYSLEPEVSDQTPGRVLVKPYHERVTKMAKFWMQHPIQGWAEMANQALYHAAGAGHLHQPVHVAEHNMGVGHEKEPAVVVHMTPGAQMVAQMPRSEYHPSMIDDLHKIATLDFLTHNMDRHAGNLLFVPQASVNPQDARLSRLVAIDHGRSFQYKSSVKGLPKFAWHPFYGKVPIPEHKRPNPNEDSLIRYVNAHGIQAVDRHDDNNGHIAQPGQYIPRLVQWWPKVRENVRAEMERQAQAIKDPKIRNHILTNFHTRADLLDRIVEDPDYYTTDAIPEEFSIPLIDYETGRPKQGNRHHAARKPAYDPILD